MNHIIRELEKEQLKEVQDFHIGDSVRVHLEIAEGEMRQRSLDDLRREICAGIACRAAIKINTRLDAAKMEWLLRALSETDCPMSCPHGRPIAMHYSTREILKAFHRI